jgi:hypothetical protein
MPDGKYREGSNHIRRKSRDIRRREFLHSVKAAAFEKKKGDEWLATTVPFEKLERERTLVVETSNWYRHYNSGGRAGIGIEIQRLSLVFPQVKCKYIAYSEKETDHEAFDQNQLVVAAGTGFRIAGRFRGPGRGVHLPRFPRRGYGG